MAIPSARWLGELAALRASAPFISFYGDVVLLRWDPAFVPKVSSGFYQAQVLVLPSIPEVVSSTAECLWLCWSSLGL